MFKFLSIILLLIGAAPTVAAQSDCAREDYFVTSEPNIRIHVRKVILKDSAVKKNSPLILVHGGGGGGIASFDVEVPGYSLAEDFARAGYAVYLMDVRGYGDSTKPTELNDSSPSAKSTVTAENVAKDIDAVINDARRRQRVKKVNVFGWASGGHWLGYYTAKHNEKINKLIILNALYGVDAPWKLRQSLEDESKPGFFSETIGAVRIASATNLTAAWTNSIPLADKTAWRDQRVVDFYVKRTLAGEDVERRTEPPTVRLPNGFLREAYEMSKGKKIFDAAKIRVPTLVIRGEFCHWSRPEDLTAMEKDLKNAPRKKLLTIASGTHFLFIDRPEHGRDVLIREVISFLRSSK